MEEIEAVLGLGYGNEEVSESVGCGFTSGFCLHEMVKNFAEVSWK